MALIELGSPELLLLTPLFITLTLLGHYFAQRIKTSLEIFHFPPLKRLNRVVLKKESRRSSWRGVGLALKLVIIVLITFSLSNPTVLTLSETTAKTVEVPMVSEKDVIGQIVLTLDASASMGIRDVSPSRLDAAKIILSEFVQNASDNVGFGLVAFDREVRKALPFTNDKNTVVSTIQNLTLPEALPCLEEFTDIGYGLQISLDLLAPFASSGKAGAIILVSDGFANFGYPNAFQSVLGAVERANSTRIPIYTVHIAKLGQDSNDELMRQIAEKTQGKFLDSTSLSELRNVLDFIGRYYVPTHEWSSSVEIKTTLPVKTGLGFTLMIMATALVLVLWFGNYKHYKTSF